MFVLSLLSLDIICTPPNDMKEITLTNAAVPKTIIIAPINQSSLTIIYSSLIF